MKKITKPTILLIIWMAIAIYLISTTESQTINYQPKTKPDTINVHIGVQTGINVLKNDFDAEGDSLRCSGNALRNGTTTYPLNAWMILPTCSVRLSGTGNLEVMDRGIIGSVNTVSYIVKDGKHSGGIVGKIVINILPPLPLEKEKVIMPERYLPVIFSLIEPYDGYYTLIQIANKFHFGKLQQDTIDGYYFKGIYVYIGDPRHELYEKDDVLGFTIGLTRNEWLAIKENETRF